MIRIHIQFQCHVHVHKNQETTPNLPTETTTKDTSLADYTEQQIAHARQQGCFSRARNYRTALQSFLRFREGKDLPLSKLTSQLTADYERWLKNQGIRMGTLSCYLRSLRAIYNKAVEEKHVTDQAPFSKRYTGNPRTDKRSITADDIRRLHQLRLPNGSYLQLARDLFLFCILACGMPFVDVAFLRKSQISDDGYLTYHRRKTHRPIRLHLLPEALEIIRRYQSTTSEYVFPLLTETQPEKAYRQYKEKLCYYNKVLKELGQKAGIRHNLTSYVSRHSWASLAYDTNTDMAVISKGLGHTSPNTTLIYIKGIDDTRLDDANRKIWKRILTQKKGEKNRNSVQEVGAN